MLVFARFRSILSSRCGVAGCVQLFWEDCDPIAALRLRLAQAQISALHSLFECFTFAAHNNPDTGFEFDRVAGIIDLQRFNLTPKAFGRPDCRLMAGLRQKNRELFAAPSSNIVGSEPAGRPQMVCQDA